MNSDEIIKKSDEFLKQMDKQLEKIKAKQRQEEIIKNYKGSDEAVSFESIYEHVKTLPPKKYISTGYMKLDECLGGGLSAGELMLVTGFTGNGKTSFCFDMTRNMKEQNCFWLPFEESGEELARKCLIWNQAPLHFFLPKTMIREDLGWIEERILEAVIKHASKVVFIDNLHFLTMNEEGDKIFSKTANLAKQLKIIAGKLNVAIVLVAHLRKSKEGIITKMPTFEDVSGSSDIVKVANKIICIWRECKKESDGKLVYENKNKVAIQKVREANGKLDTVDFIWDKGIFKEQSIEQSIADHQKQVEKSYEYKD